MEFLDVNFTKELSLLLHAIPCPFFWRILKTVILYSGVKNTYTKIRETRKLESFHGEHLGEGVSAGRIQDKNSSPKRLDFMPKSLS
jgi:hypothetical protein